MLQEQYSPRGTWQDIGGVTCYVTSSSSSSSSKDSSSSSSVLPGPDDAMTVLLLPDHFPLADSKALLQVGLEAACLLLWHTLVATTMLQPPRCQVLYCVIMPRIVWLCSCFDLAELLVKDLHRLFDRNLAPLHNCHCLVFPRQLPACRWQTRSHPRGHWWCWQTCWVHPPAAETATPRSRAMPLPRMQAHTTGQRIGEAVKCWHNTSTAAGFTWL